MYQQVATNHHSAVQKSKFSVSTETECPYSHVPNTETECVLMEIDAGIGLIECKDINDMFEKLGI